MLVSRSHRYEGPGRSFLHHILRIPGVSDNLPNEFSWMRGFPRNNDKAVRRFQRPWLMTGGHALHCGSDLQIKATHTFAGGSQ
jgi:hypothetical protein